MRSEESRGVGGVSGGARSGLGLFPEGSVEWLHQLCSLERGWRDVKLKAQRLVRRLLSSDKGPVRGCGRELCLGLCSPALIL